MANGGLPRLVVGMSGSSAPQFGVAFLRAVRLRRRRHPQRTVTARARHQGNPAQLHPHTEHGDRHAGRRDRLSRAEIDVTPAAGPAPSTPQPPSAAFCG
jgi:hypothetical protein